MAAANTDLLRKGVAQWSGVIGSGGVNDAIVTTIPLSSVSGIPTDTAIMITINRVDTLGKVTGNFEGVVGVISGNNVIDCLRGVEGTAQAWLAGTVVEILFTADNWNDLIDAFLVNFNQDGTIKNHIGETTYTPAGAGTTTLDLSLGNIFTVTMPAATQTLATSNAVVGQVFLVAINNVTSQGALTWFTTIRWADGAAGSLTGTNGKRDTFGFRCTGAGTFDGFIVGQNI